MRPTAGQRRCALALAAGVAAALSMGPAHAQSAALDNSFTESRSGQFAAQVLYHATPDPVLVTNQSLVRLDPAVVVVSCERVRDILWRELAVRGPWVSKVSILIYPALTPEETITVVSDRFKNGWQYQVYMPQMVERERYVRGLTQVVLLELANRNAEAHGAEIPLWLVEGFSRRLLATSDSQVILPSPESRGGRPITPPAMDFRFADPLTHAHEILAGQPLPTFQDLSWPNNARWSGDAAEVYRCTAQLFVTRLLKLPDGRACFRAFLAALPAHYNWQLAFLPAFHSHFERPLEVEKWWAIQTAEFVGRRLDQTWATETSLQKLEQAIRAPVDVRTSTNELPLHAEARLQERGPRLGPGDANPGARGQTCGTYSAPEPGAAEPRPPGGRIPPDPGRLPAEAGQTRPGAALPQGGGATRQRRKDHRQAECLGCAPAIPGQYQLDLRPPPASLAQGAEGKPDDLAGTFSPVPPRSRPGQ